MENIIDLAMKYGGFTMLDKVYLTHHLRDKTRAEQLEWITPPPSVVNAYFAELYQKKTPEAACDYFFNLSRELQLFNDRPSFEEVKPFIRLNLQGKSFGFAYCNEEKEAIVFPEVAEQVTATRLFEIAQIFPGYVVYMVGTQIRMHPNDMNEKNWQGKEQSEFLLTDIAISAGVVKLSGLNQDEVVQASQDYPGTAYYAWSGRSAILYKKD